MSRSIRTLATGVAAGGVLVAGGAAVALGLGTATASPTSSDSTVSALQAGGANGEQRVLGPTTLEVAILDVNRPRRAFRRITGAALEALLPQQDPAPDPASE